MEDITNFRINRVKELKKMYADIASTAREFNQALSSGQFPVTAAGVRKLLQDAITDPSRVVELSEKLYAMNPIYSSIINYLSNMYTWAYTVVPHKVYTKSKAKMRKIPAEADFNLMYAYMLEVVDGVNIATRFPAILQRLFTGGSVYFTTTCDENSYVIDTILLPNKYCRKIGETQYNTSIIQFDFSYFMNLGLSEAQLKDYLKSFPSEFQKGYNRYLKDSVNARWQELDPRFSSGILANQYAVPTLFYLYGGILDYEKYEDNELERNENLLKYLVVQKMPIYQDKLVFEVDEVNALHKSMKKVIDTGNKARLITTFGDVDLLKIAENDTVANQVLEKAFKSIFNNAGFNSGIFTAESVEALKLSLIRDKGLVWKYVNELLNFYSIAINNWFDFKDYEANIDILPISPYTYDDDIETYKNNATLGVGKIQYIVAAGIKQKNICDTLILEKFLHLDEITPMQTSYTQTAKDREAINGSESSTENKSGIEPLDVDSSEEQSNQNKE